MSFILKRRTSSFPQPNSTSGQAEGLGRDFIMTVQQMYQRLLESPAAGPAFGQRLRRLLVPKFPYGVLYRIEPERIYIVAVMHLHRRPGYWRSRL